VIPFVDLKAQYHSIKPDIDAAVLAVLESTQFVLGNEVAAFEEEFAGYSGGRHGIAVNSGTSALHLALLAAGIGPGDEVITTPFTFVATAAAIRYTGARPVYADIDPHSFNLDPARIEAAITERTKAILPVHLYGQPADMAARFPGCLAYLLARRVELETRHVSGGAGAERQFYQFGRSQSLLKFDSPKIILPALSIEPRYAYDDANIVVTGGGNGPYYLLRARAGAAVTDKYLLAVLNHPLSEAFVRTNTSPFRGGYYAHGKQFIEDLPIPVPTAEQRAEIDALVTQTTAALADVLAARTPHDKTLAERRVSDLRARIEASVTLLFDLSPADLDIVHAVPVPS